jgi:hypothetical protein
LSEQFLEYAQLGKFHRQADSLRAVTKSGHLRELLVYAVPTAESFGRSAAHSSNWSRAGHTACPHLVKAYSTLGGTCGCTVRVTMPSRSSSRSCWIAQSYSFDTPGAPAYE